MPAPTTHTSAWTSSRRAGRGARSTVSSQSEERVVIPTSSPPAVRKRGFAPRQTDRCAPVQLSLVLSPAWRGLWCVRQRRDAAAAQRFQTALEARDGQGACAELGDETGAGWNSRSGRPASRRSSRSSCRAAVRGRASVYVTSASVAVAGAARCSWTRRGRLGISAAGCRPTAPELPFDCALED